MQFDQFLRMETKLTKFNQIQNWFELIQKKSKDKWESALGLSPQQGSTCSAKRPCPLGRFGPRPMKQGGGGSPSTPVAYQPNPAGWQPLVSGEATWEKLDRRRSRFGEKGSERLTGALLQHYLSYHVTIWSTLSVTSFYVITKIWNDLSHSYDIYLKFCFHHCVLRNKMNKTRCQTCIYFQKYIN
jgi:hypothetical protein